MRKVGSRIFAGTADKEERKADALSFTSENLALIDSAEVEFGDGLNILTGETGAGNRSSSVRSRSRWAEKHRKR